MYPYSRQEECQWEADSVGKFLAEALHQPMAPDAGWHSSQVEAIQTLYGKNEISDTPEKTGWICLKSIFTALIDQLKEPLILMLLVSAAISLVLGNTADALSIAIALFIVSLVAAIQEYRSEQALEQLQNLVPPCCTVMRDGHVHDKFLASELVVGDMVLLGTGDRIPADCRLVDCVELAVDQSTLTGEKEPVLKTNSGLRLDHPSITEQGNVVFAGTLVTAGRGRGLVIAVGKKTECGKIASELSEIESRKSPLQLKIDELSQRLATVSTVAIAIIALWGWLMGRPFLETLTIAVSLAVAAIPEGLPICVTVTLALGVLRMAKHSAIVKKLPVVESLGCTTAIASDKTGTLTQNESTLYFLLRLVQYSVESILDSILYFIC